MLVYGENATTYSEPIVIIFYEAEENHAYKIKSIIGWGDAAGEFEVQLNGEVCGGFRTSDEKRTEQVWWGDSFICNPNDQIVILGTHYVQGLRKLKCNLELVRI